MEMEKEAQIKVVDTQKFIDALIPLLDQGKEVQLPVAGSSMSPFLADGRDALLLRKISGAVKKGDMVLFRRRSGQYVMHRVCRVRSENGNMCYYMIGDGQMQVEGPIMRGQILAVVSLVKRKGKWIGPGNFWWKFFRIVWLNIVPLRPAAIRGWSVFKRSREKNE